jgi:hypothetical protein
MMKKLLIGLTIVICHLSFSVVLTSCKKVDEEPALNRGYKKDIRMPDAEPMTAEDSAVVAAQKAEYELNAK